MLPVLRLSAVACKMTYSLQSQSLTNPPAPPPMTVKNVNIAIGTRPAHKENNTAAIKRFETPVRQQAGGTAAKSQRRAKINITTS